MQDKEDSFHDMSLIVMLIASLIVVIGFIAGVIVRVLQ